MKVVVTTKHRGVFFGELKSYEEDSGRVELTKARNCVYWSKDTRGFFGLAATGPLPGSRVSPEIPSVKLVDVTSVLECSNDAIAAWESGIWS